MVTRHKCNEHILLRHARLRSRLFLFSSHSNSLFSDPQVDSHTQEASACSPYIHLYICRTLDLDSSPDTAQSFRTRDLTVLTFVGQYSGFEYGSHIYWYALFISALISARMSTVAHLVALYIEAPNSCKDLLLLLFIHCYTSLILIYLSVQRKVSLFELMI